jgi:glucosylceramidase
VVNSTDYQVAARLWAMSGTFRFARPGAVRIDSSNDVDEVYVTAWENSNGTVAVPVINAAHYSYTVNVDLAGSMVNRAVAYPTDNSHNVTAMERFSFEGGNFSAQVEPRSMKTFFLSCV